MYNPMQARVTGTICVSCNTQLHSFKRVTKHLLQRCDKNKCHQFYLENVPPIEDDKLKDVLQHRIMADKAVDVKSVPPLPLKLGAIL